MGIGSTNIIPNIHTQPATGAVVDIAIEVHHGNGNVDTVLGASTAVGNIWDAWRYAKDHSSRDQDYDNKMAAVWGSTYSNLPDMQKNDLHAMMRMPIIVPPAP